MPLAFHEAHLNHCTQKFSLVPQKLTWRQQFGLQSLPKLGYANIYTDFCVDGIYISAFAILLFSKVVDMYNALFLLLVLMKIFFTFALTAYFYCCYCALF